MKISFVRLSGKKSIFCALCLDIDDAVRFLGGKINPVGHQDYDKAFTSEYWNRMKIRDTLLVIGKVRNYLLAFLIKPLIRTFHKS